MTNLFQSEPEAAGGLVYAEVAFNLPLESVYTYSVPEALAKTLAAGKRVEAPFGPQRMVGYCVRFPASAVPPEIKAKDILAVIDDAPLVDAHMLELTRWTAQRYFAGWGEALEAALPAGVRYDVGARTVVSLAVSPEAAMSETASWSKRAAKRRRALEKLVENDSRLTQRELAAAAGVSIATVAALIKTGLAVTTIARARAPRRRDPAVRDYKRAFGLTREQEYALASVREAVETGRCAPVLLFGVTGSGKTEVYLQAIEAVIRAGRQAIVLVPEISLTPQTVSRFRERFANIAVLHSSLAAGKRHREWRRIQSGSADVIIGARSAIFAPTPRLGLIVIDEEHENTFKQETAPRYHAREVAARRAQMLGIPLLLGSATPSLESFAAAQEGRFVRVDLPNRVEGRPLPPVEVVDMRAEKDARKAYTIISRRLEWRMRTALAAGGQVILFLNRRGFATYLTCRRCGWVGKCPHCDITLTFHRTFKSVNCHYCGHSADPPTACPDCGAGNVRFFGVGTERIVEEVNTLFPEATVGRMDSDTMTSRRSYTKALRDFRQGSVSVLVGTQMIAKGLDFPNVTVVGVVSADVSLGLPDFRASERTFDLICQVAGRTGRGERGGVVVVQTYTPDNFAIEAAAKHDYLRFAKRELEQRAELKYPPFGQLARIILRCEDEGKCEAAALKVADAMREAPPAGTQVLGPAAAPIGRIQGMYRWHLIVKAPDGATLAAALAPARKLVKASGAVQGVVDVDPLSML
jgi:primosomal protein N' (replication factor Y)